MATTPQRLFRAHDLVGRKPVTEEQAALNRKLKKSPVRPRPGIDGLLPFGPATLWRMVRAKTFPQPLRIGGVTAWRVEDVVAWIAEQK